VDFDPVLDRWAEDFVALARSRGLPAHLEAPVQRAARGMLAPFLRAMLDQTEAEFAPRPLGEEEVR